MPQYLKLPLPILSQPWEEAPSKAPSSKLEFSPIVLLVPIIGIEEGRFRGYILIQVPQTQI